MYVWIKKPFKSIAIKHRSYTHQDNKYMKIYLEKKRLMWTSAITMDKVISLRTVEKPLTASKNQWYPPVSSRFEAI